jgi:LPS export ABC transporter permease LptF
MGKDIRSIKAITIALAIHIPFMYNLIGKDREALWFMRTMTRYVLLDLIKVFVLSLLFFTFGLLLDKLFSLADMIINKGVELKTMLLLFFYILPSILALTIPMSTLMATLITYGRLSADNELVALMASGISPIRIISPAIYLSIVLTAISVPFNDQILPRANYSYKLLYYSIFVKHPSISVEENVFIKVQNRDIYLRKFHPREKRGEGILIYDDSIPGFSLTVLAPRGRWVSRKDGAIELILENCTIHQLERVDSPVYRVIKTSTYRTIINPNYGRSIAGIIGKGDREMTGQELRREIKKLERSVPQPRRTINALWVEYYKKTSIPFASLAFALVGPILGMMTRRGGKTMGFGIALAFFVVYYLALLGGEALGDRGYIHPFLSMWLPNITLSIAGIFMILGSYRPRSPITAILSAMRRG